jgi:hypothetical protein
VSNVTKGDLAKVLNSAGVEPGLPGAMVLVIGLAEPHSFLDACKIAQVEAKYGGPVWEIEMLESRQGARSTYRAGEHLMASNHSLKRIDPPVGDVDLYRTEPLPGEKIDAAFFDLS